MRRKKGLREVQFWPCGHHAMTTIYDNGHLDKAAFLAAVKAWDQSDVPEHARAALTVKNVRHARFRPGSTTVTGGYPVTLVDFNDE